MNSEDLKEILEDLNGDAPNLALHFNGPYGAKLTVTKIESKPDGVHVDLGFTELPNRADPCAWQPDFTGV